MISEYRQEMRAVGAEARRTALGFILKVFVPIFLVCAVLGGGWFLVNRPAAVMNEVLDKDNIIYNYQWYFDTFNACKSLDKKIITAEDDVTTFEEQMKGTPRNEWGFTNTGEYSRLQSVVTGLKNQRADLAGEYNSRSSQATRNWFKNNKLPATIPIDGLTE